MKRRWMGTVATLSTAAALGASAAPRRPMMNARPSNPSTEASSLTIGAFQKDLQPLLQSFCISCHSGKSPAARLSLEAWVNTAAILATPKDAEHVLAKLSDRTMPPPGLPRPADAQYRKAAAWLRAQLEGPACDDNIQPGRVTMRRLNRMEYRFTIRDLAGVDFKAAADFPSDDVGYGFDNIGDVLSLPPLLLEKYLDAADAIVKEGYPRIAPNPPAAPAAQDAWAKAILAGFTRRAFRRPATAAELTRLFAFITQARKAGHPVDDGLKLALQAVLVSPHFLFRVESGSNGPKGGPIGDYALASRLSYFLWSSLPDDALLTLAAKNTLHQPETLRTQVKRMLRDPKAEALADTFAAQWLETRRLKTAQPDPDVFPGFDDDVRNDMIRETALFFNAVVREDRSVLDFLDGRYTYLNERLAKLYGIPNVSGPQFRKVALPPGDRAGVLTQGSILTLTSNPTRNSPVKRGKFVLEEFLDAAPPPPPPGTPPLVVGKAAKGRTLREQMEQHRADPKCASCHLVMDPIGFSLDRFDAVGRVREKDGDAPINTKGQLPDGKTFEGAPGLRALLMSRKPEFARTLTRKMLTFALGRGLERADRCAVDAIAVRLAKDQYRFSSLVLGVVESPPFLQRAADPAPKPLSAAKTATAKSATAKPIPPRTQPTLTPGKRPSPPSTPGKRPTLTPSHPPLRKAT